MKILTVREPWASLIIFGAKTHKGRVWKDIENRGFPTKIRGRFAIHAGKSKTGLNATLLQLENNGMKIDPTSLKFGAVIGSVDLSGCVEDSTSRWFEGPYGYTLKYPFAFPKPIPCEGQLGFFEKPEITRMLAKYERLRQSGQEE